MIMDVYCIHLEYRSDRFAHLKAMQARYPSIRINLIDGIRHMNPLLGCQLSHKMCVQMAKDKRWPYIIVLEDDCDFLLSDAELLKCFQTMIDYHKAHPEVDIVNGCGNLEDFIIDSSEEFQGMHFLRSPKVFTGHCIIYTASVYDKVLAVSPGILIDAMQSNWNIVYTYPYLATQIQSYSNLVRKVVEYNNIEASRNFVANHIHRLHNEDRHDRDGDGSEPALL